MTKLFQPAPIGGSVSDVLVGNIFWTTNKTPRNGLLFSGESYAWIDNPKLKQLYDDINHQFIIDNNDGTFTIEIVEENLKGTTNELSVGSQPLTNDGMTAPGAEPGENRLAIFGIYGDQASVAIDTTLASKGSILLSSSEEWVSSEDIVNKFEEYFDSNEVQTLLDQEANTRLVEDLDTRQFIITESFTRQNEDSILQQQLDDLPDNPVLESFNKVQSGFVLSGTQGASSFEISAGTAIFYDVHTDPLNPTKVELDYAGGTISSSSVPSALSFVYVGIQQDGTLVYESLAPNISNIEDTIWLGFLTTTDSWATINLAGSTLVNLSPLNLLALSIGIININNVTVTPVSGTLQLNLPETPIYYVGRNWGDQADNRIYPNIRTVPAVNQISFSYIDSTGQQVIAPSNTLTLNQYENSAGNLQTITGDNASVQRLYLSASGSITMLIGQAQYNNLNQAIQRFSGESVTVPPVLDGFIQIATIIARQDATDLSNTNQCRIIPGGKFGEGGTGSSSIAELTATNTTVNFSPINYVPAAATVEQHLVSIDSSLSNSGSSLPSRTDSTVTTASISVDATEETIIPLSKTFGLMSVETDVPAWVRIYNSSAKQIDDRARSIDTDPTGEHGVIAEVLTTTDNLVINFNQMVFGFSLEATPSSDIPISITNKDSSASTIQTTITYLPGES